jgi:hypothetical protein
VKLDLVAGQIKIRQEKEMRVQITDQMMIDAPASKVWRVLAHEFENIGQWSSGIAESKSLADLPVPDGAMVGGRVCFAPGFGADAPEEFTYEAFTYYDEQSMRFGYEAIGDLPWPWLLKHAQNNWSVRSSGPDQSVAEFRAEVDVNAFPGLLLIPLMPLIKKVLGTRTLEELKHYVEHDQPHPRKQKMQRQMQVA